MATIEREGVLSYVDENGDIIEMYPEIKTDTSLSTSGKAADAKVVGDEVVKAKNTLDTKVSALETKLNSFGIIKSDIVNSPLGTALSMPSNTEWVNMITSLTGVANKGAWNGSISTSGGSVTIPKGYHNGSGKVTGPTLSSLIDTNVTLASAANLLSGVTAYGKNGVKYTGTDKGYDAGYEDGRAVKIANYEYGTWKPSSTEYIKEKGYVLAFTFIPDIFFLRRNGTNDITTNLPFFIYCDTPEVSFEWMRSGNGNSIISDYSFTIIGKNIIIDMTTRGSALSNGIDNITLQYFAAEIG